MYELINDINAYPTFLPDCQDSKIITQNESEITAALLVSKGGIKKWFSTKNKLVPYQKIELALVDGPFKKLSGAWELTSLSDDACKVSLQLNYEFSSKLIEMAFGRVFSHMANNMVQVFISRANEVYGNHV
jgi:ribosome-associated toxin RatA of RatAB toxin-antitoxin module